MKHRNLNRCIGLCCIMIMLVNLCGFSVFSSSDPVLYTENRKLYKTYSADDIISLFLTRYELAEEKYDGQYVAVLGRVYRTEKNGKKVFLGSPIETYGTTIECKLENKADIVYATGVSEKNYVLVFGQLEMSSYFGNTSLSMEVDKVLLWNSSSISNTAYAMTNGVLYDENAMLRRSLANGRIKYKIPAGWGAVETKLANVEGYQYRLNEQTSNFRVEPESAFVFYFDNNRFLLNLSDKSKTGRIEDAIIENILQGDGNDGKKKEKKSHFGIDFDYYTSYFRNTENKAYNVEFVFVPIDEEGFLVILYVFNEQVHTDQIRAVMRMLEL